MNDGSSGLILGTGGSGTSLTVMNAGANIIDGLTITTLGLKTSYGVTINSGGLYLTSGGLTVSGVSPLVLFKVLYL